MYGIPTMKIEKEVGIFFLSAISTVCLQCRIATWKIANCREKLLYTCILKF